MASPEVERPMTSPSARTAPSPVVHHQHQQHRGRHHKVVNLTGRYHSLGGRGWRPRRDETGVQPHTQLHQRGKNSSSTMSASTSTSSVSNTKRSSGGGSGSSSFGPTPPVRKRSYSFSEGHCKSVQSVPPSKRWKNHHGRKTLSSASGGPGGGQGEPSGASSSGNNSSKFLLGGNIRDPLNLNSLSDERVARVVNAVTPESSPIPTPKHRKAEYKIEVLIPPDISDPLNLMQEDYIGNEDDYEASLVPSGGFNKRKPRHRKRTRSTVNKKDDEDSEVKEEPAVPSVSSKKKIEASKLTTKILPPPSSQKDEKSSSTSVAASTAASSTSAATTSTETNTETSAATTTTTTTTTRIKGKQPIVSPVVRVGPPRRPFKQRGPKVQQGMWQYRQQNKMVAAQTSSSNGKKVFEFGNYNRYYNYRNDGDDPRLQYFCADWFRGKDVLDIGCNVGQVTLAIARDMGPKSILGIDIDQSLVAAARRNLQHYANRRVPSAMATPNPAVDGSGLTKSERLFPQSLPILFGPLDPTSPGEEGVQETPKSLPSQGPMCMFPHNLRFICDNYVLESDDLLSLTQPEFDTILCLSTTKWIQLNFGDDGIKRAFKRMHAQLRPGGLLVLEPQSLTSYTKKRKVTDQARKNFADMKLKPEGFKDYLVNEVGFTGGDVVAVPQHSSAGFRRPITVFAKKKPESS